jgi:hypothetical protein
MLTPTRTSIAAAAVLAATLAVVAAMVAPAAPAHAALATPPRPPIIVSSGPAGGTVGIDVHSPGSPGHGGKGAGDSASKSGPVSDPCGQDPTGTACAAFDHAQYCAAWAQTFVAGGLPSTGLGPLMRRVGCGLNLNLTAIPFTSAVLAQQAYGLLQLPSPTIERSPDAANSDHGIPYTWVNLWTWFWTDPATFTAKARTVSAGAISATATATPTALIFDPGTGDAPVTCPGPGRPWQTADGNGAPTGGGCGYMYRHISTSVTTTVSIRWTVTWTGSNGETGQLPPLTTVASSTFAVEQVQVVNR